MNENDSITVNIDGQEWTPSNHETAEYDAIHAIAGAILAGAEHVSYGKVTESDDISTPLDSNDLHEQTPRRKFRRTRKF